MVSVFSSIFVSFIFRLYVLVIFYRFDGHLWKITVPSDYNLILFCCVTLLLTSCISVFVGLVIMNFLALFYLLMFNENNILITCWSFTLDR